MTRPAFCMACDHESPSWIDADGSAASDWCDVDGCTPRILDVENMGPYGRDIVAAGDDYNACARVGIPWSLFLAYIDAYAGSVENADPDELGGLVFTTGGAHYWHVGYDYVVASAPGLVEIMGRALVEVDWNQTTESLDANGNLYALKYVDDDGALVWAGLYGPGAELVGAVEIVGVR